MKDLSKVAGKEMEFQKQPHKNVLFEAIKMIKLFRFDSNTQIHRFGNLLFKSIFICSHIKCIKFVLCRGNQLNNKER